MARAWLAVVALSCGACGSGGSTAPAPLAILNIEPACPPAGGTISLTLGGGEVAACDAGRVFAGHVELVNLGVVTASPLKVAARLPPGVGLMPGQEVRIACGTATASLRWFGRCSPGGGLLDAAAAPADATAPDASPSCPRPIEAVVEVVDKYGQPFERNAEGVFLVPITAEDFAFDSGKSRHVSGHEVLYTFSSDCFPRVTVKAPVFGGFGTDGLWIDRVCQLMVEILDSGCAQVRLGRARASFQLVPPP